MIEYAFLTSLQKFGGINFKKTDTQYMYLRMISESI